MIFPYAPSYRQAIYELMDNRFDIDWYFAGNREANLKLYDYKRLRNCDLRLHETKILGPLVRYKHDDIVDLEKYDVVVIPGMIRSWSDWKRLIQCKLKKNAPKIWLWTHGWYDHETKIQKRIKRLFFSLPDGFLVYGNYARNLMIANGIPGEKIKVISNSLDYDTQLNLRKSLKPSGIYRKIFGNDYPTLIFLGRLLFWKELDRLLDSAAALRQRGLEVNICLVGDGEARESLTRRAKELSLRVHFHGECFDERKNAQLLSEADLCVSPGNVGLTSIHSLMFGTPLVTHNSFPYQGPEFEAVVPGKTGDFFKRRDTADMTDVIEKWLRNNTSRRDEIRESCYREIDGRWNPHAQLKVLEEVLG